MQHVYIRKDGHRVGAIAFTNVNDRVFIGGSMVTPEDRKATHLFNPKVTADVAIRRAARKSWKHKESHATSFKAGSIGRSDLKAKIGSLRLPFNKWGLTLDDVVAQVVDTMSSDSLVTSA